METALDLLGAAEKIVVFTGAGISTNCGVQDFRGPEGLYKTAEEKYHLPYPEALFDMDYFRRDPHPFFDLTKNMFLLDLLPSLCHKLVFRLEQQGRISLVVTQNIDMLHQKAGSIKLMECHGSYEQAHCLGCRKEYLLKDIEESIMNDVVPRCSCGAVVKPDVVFFGENLPDDFYRILENPPPCDLILILGTSLNVQPASLFALEMAAKVPSLLVNLQRTDYDSQMDLVLHSDLDLFADYMMKKLPQV